MPKINLGTVLTTLKNEPFKNGSPELKFLLDADGKIRRSPAGEPLVELHPDGRPVIVKEAPDMTLGDVCLAALNATLQSDKQATPELKDQTAKFMLAIKLSNGGEQDLTADEITMLKKRVQEMYAPSYVVVVRACAALDPSDPACHTGKAKAVRK